VLMLLHVNLEAPLTRCMGQGNTNLDKFGARDILLEGTRGMGVFSSRAVLFSVFASWALQCGVVKQGMAKWFGGLNGQSYLKPSLVHC
jgi:hypothetical protein